MPSRALRTIASNAGQDGSVVLHKVVTSEDAYFGYDASNDTYENMFDPQVLDPTKVVKPHLKNSFRCNC